MRDNQFSPLCGRQFLLSLKYFSTLLSSQRQFTVPPYKSLSNPLNYIQSGATD